MTKQANKGTRLAIRVLSLAISSSITVTVVAQTVTPDASPDASNQEENRRKAFEAFEEGVALYDKESYTQASKAFRRANRFSYNWKILYNIGQCEAAAKRYGMALEAFEEYLARAGDEISVSRRDDVIAEVARLRQMVGMLEVKAPEGAKIELNGVDRGTAPLTGPIMVSAGVAHQLSVVHHGEIVFAQAIKLTGGQEKTVQVDPSTGDKNATPNDGGNALAPSDSKVSHGKARRIKVAGWLALGTGTALAVGGLVVGGVGFSQANALSEDHDGRIPPEKENEVNRLKKMGLMADIFIGAGAGIAITGVVLLIVHKKKFTASEKVTLSPSLAPGFTGGMLTGRF